MISESFISRLSVRLGTEIKKVSPISGGDISSAFLVETSTDRLFLKTNNEPFAAHMFATEKKGLDLLGQTKSIRTPEVMHTGNIESTAFIVMEYVESKRGGSNDLKKFGHQLADLHLNSADAFGLNHDNYIGKLTQSNTPDSNWISFYAKERLLPQLEMAVQKRLLLGSEIPSIGKIKGTLNRLMGSVNPSLIHGDLWSGNYLISTSGVPFLIDPAIYYGHGEVDIAMSRLFGSFGSAFYDAYFEKMEVASGLEERIEIYQLYYLLVHLNLFGAGYRSAVQKILQRYFKEDSSF